MNPATPATIGAITTVRDAVMQALRAAGDALNSGDTQTAQTQWNAAHAALRVVDHKALVRVSEELGNLLVAADINVETRAPAFNNGATALDTYISELVAGRADQPLRMIAAYRALHQARGVEQVADSDLYFPNLGLTPADRPEVVALDAERLRALRRQLEGGLLGWLRKPDDSAGLRQVRDVLQAVEAGQSSGRQRALWWAVQAVVDALLNGGLAADNLVRRLITQANLQLGRLVQGNADYPDSLLRDALYHAARAQPVTPLVQAVQQYYMLAGSLDVSEPAAAGASAEMLAAAKKHTEGLNDVWAACAAGSASIAAFVARAEALRMACQPLGSNALNVLVAQLVQTAQSLAASGAHMSDATALEGANVLLLIAHRLDGLSTPGAGFDAQAQNMAARLKLSVDAPDTLATLPPAELLDDEAKHVEARGLVLQVQGEVSSGLSRIEQTLDEWFREPNKRDALAALDKPFAQIAGALTVLQHEDAAALLNECRAEVARYAAGAPSEAEAQQLLARRLTALSGFARAAQQGPVNLHDMLVQAGLEAPRAAPEPVVVLQPASVLEPVLVAAPVEPVALVAIEAAPPVPMAEQASIDNAADTDPEMLEVFIEEAGEVMATISTTLPESRNDPQNQELLTTIRRAFHTLKGSGRMVGLKHLGEAAWEMEQVMNDMLPQRQPGTPDFYRLVEYAHGCFARWVDELRNTKQAGIDAAQLVDWAKKLRAGEALPAPATAPPAVATIPAAPVVVDAPTPAPVEETLDIGGTRISRELYDIFVSEARQYADALAPQNRRVQAGEKADPEFMRMAHTLNGISGTAGFTAVRALSHSLEQALQQTIERNVAPAANMREAIDHAVTALSAQIAAISAKNAPADESALVAALDAARARSVAPVVPIVEPVVTSPVASAPVVHPVSPPTAAPAAPRVPGLQVVADRRRYRLADDIDAQLLPIFLAEAQDLVPQVGQDLRDWRAKRDDKLIPQSLKRLLHTLKGSARMAGAMGLGELTHSMESRVENATLLPLIPDNLFDELETSFDRIGVLIEQLQSAEPKIEPEQPAQELPEGMDQMAKSMRIATITMPAAEPAQVVGQQPAVQVVTAQRPLLRVRADLVDRLANQAGEVSIARSRIAAEMRSVRASLRDLSENIGRLRSQLRELEIQAETQMQSRFTLPQEAAADGKFDPLEFDRFTRLQELTRLMAESVNDVATVQQNLIRDLDEGEKALSAQARMTREVQQELMAVRMVQFSSLNDRLYRVTRLAAKDSSKRVNLDIKGGHVELDRSVLDRVAAPFEHLLRNAIAHGVEAPARRVELGKAEAGEIVIDVQQEGNEAVLTISDDGTGLNIERIRAKAVALGLMRPDEQLSDAEVGDFIFRSGFSTAANVTEVAGRGVGMDVVMNEISGLGGRIETAFELGKGTRFTIYLPLTLAILQAVVLRVGGNHYAVPTLMVEQVQKVKQDALANLRAAGVIEWQGTRYPFYHLRRLLGLPAAAGDGERFTPILLLRSGPHRTAIQVDDLIGGQEIVIKNIGPQLARVPGITGAAVLGTGETVLILNPVLLSQRAEEITRSSAQTQPVPAIEPAPVPAASEPVVAESDVVSEATPQAVMTPATISTPPVTAAPAPAAQPAVPRTVMVVDDSLTVRKITGRLLAREGYEVIVAKDGIEALEKLQDRLPDVMLTDVEMPRMDGFDLTRNVRADAAMKSLPIIMITSRTADKHRQHATELGVDVFLGKPYEESALLGHIADLLKARH